MLFLICPWTWQGYSEVPGRNNDRLSFSAECTCMILLLSDNKILLALSRCEPEPLLALGPRHSSSSSPPSSSASSVTSTESDNAKYKIISTLSDFYDRELVGTIGWAKQIPGECS